MYGRSQIGAPQPPRQLNNQHTVPVRQLVHNERVTVDEMTPLPAPVRDALANSDPTIFDGRPLATCFGSTAAVMIVPPSTQFAGAAYLWTAKQPLQRVTAPCRQLPIAPKNLPDSALAVCFVPQVHSSVSLADRCGLAIACHDGTIMYWRELLQETVEEVKADLETGDSLERLAFCLGGTLIAVSARGKVFVVSLDAGTGRIVVQPLAPTLGVFGMFGSALGFGAKAVDVSGRVLAMVAGDDIAGSPNEREFFILSENKLQVYRVQNGRQEVAVRAEQFVPAMVIRPSTGKLVTEIDFNSLIYHKLVEEEGDPNTRLTVWILDLQWSSGAGLIALVASIAVGVELPTLLYSLVHVQFDATAATASVGPVINLQYTPDYEPEIAPLLLAARLTLTTGPAAYVYSPQAVVMCSIHPDDNRSENTIPLGQTDALLGSALVYPVTLSTSSTITDTHAMFVSRQHGVVRITQPDLEGADAPVETVVASAARASAAAAQSASVADIAPMASVTPVPTRHQPHTAADQMVIDKCFDQLSVAFAARCGGEVSAARKMAAILSTIPVDSIAAVLVRLSSHIIDAHPQSDPRWAEQDNLHSPAVSSHTSLILLQQLELKRRQHQMLLDVLTSINCWPHLSLVTCHVLFEHGQRIAAAIALRKWQSTTDHPEETKTLLERCFRRFVDKRRVAAHGAADHGAVAAQDAFYRELSRIEQLFSLLREEIEHSSPVKLLSVMSAVCEAVLKGAAEYRETKANLYHLDSKQELLIIPNPPFHCNPVVRRDLLVLHARCSAEMAQGAAVVLARHAFVVADLILSSFVNQLEWIATFNSSPAYPERDVVQQQYHATRTAIIQPLIQQGLRDLASTLAERYEDFPSLVVLCDADHDTARLHQYMDRFAASHFAQFVFQTYLENGRLQELFTQPEHLNDVLAEFLATHPSISHLHDIRRQHFGRAYTALSHEAQRELRDLENKKNKISLAKLALLCTDTEQAHALSINAEHSLKQLDDQLYLCDVQLELPETVKNRLVPFPSLQLILALIHLPPAEIEAKHLCSALEVYALSRHERSDDENQTILIDIWVAGVCSDVSRWKAICDLVTGDASAWTDSTARNLLTATIFYEMRVHCCQVNRYPELLVDVGQIMASQSILFAFPTPQQAQAVAHGLNECERLVQ